MENRLIYRHRKMPMHHQGSAWSGRQQQEPIAEDTGIPKAKGILKRKKLRAKRAIANKKRKIDFEAYMASLPDDHYIIRIFGRK
jgi:hypothetical protein